MKSYDLIGCGALNLDLIYRLPADSPLWHELPPPGAEQAVDARAARRASTRRWPASNRRAAAAARRPTPRFALARLGFSAAMLGRVGADEAGRFLASELAPCDARYLARDGESGRVYVLLNEAGERRNLVWPAANDEFSPADLPRRLPAARFAYFSSFVGERAAGHPARPARAAARRRRDRLRPRRDLRPPRREVLHPVPQAHLVRVRHRDASSRRSAACTADKALSFLLDVGVGLVVCKMGDRGAQIVGRRLDLYVPPHPAEVVDVTGAGDLFAAGFIGGLLEGLGLESAGRLAAWAASRGIAGLGRSTYPDAAAWRERVAEERGEAA